MRRLLGIALGFFFAFLTLAFYAQATISSAAPQDGFYYDVIPEEEKMGSSKFISQAMQPDSYLLFGSSELGAGAYTMEQHPNLFFRSHNIGYSPMLVGSAHTQSLQFSLYAGALADKVPNNKLALIVSPQWFQTADINSQAFRSRFSWDVYRDFLHSDVSADLKAAVLLRLQELGMDEAHLAAAKEQSDNPVDVINSACFEFIDAVQTSHKLASVLGNGYLGASQTAQVDRQPDWRLWQNQARDAGSVASSSNSFGIDDSYFAEYIAADLDILANTDSRVSFLSSREYDDLTLFLDICASVNLEPLIVIAPVNGLWYDYSGMSSLMRQEYYATIRKICDAHAVQYLDLSVFEQEKYVMRDVMHLGWLGWLYAEEGFYDFIMAE